MSLKLAPFFLYDNFVFSLSVFIIHLGQELILFPWKAIAQSHPDLFCLYVTYLPAFIPSQGWRSTYCPDLFLCAWLAWSFDFQRNTLDREIDVCLHFTVFEKCLPIYWFSLTKSVGSWSLKFHSTLNLSLIPF